jgi:hypothetical protein
MKKQLIVGILVLVAMLSGHAVAWAETFIDNDTNVTVPFKFRQNGQDDWSDVVYLKAWGEFTSSEIVEITFNTRKEQKRYSIEPNTVYAFKETTDGTIDLYRQFRRRDR